MNLRGKLLANIIIFTLFLSFFALKTSAQSVGDIRSSEIDYTRGLWFYFLQSDPWKKEFENTVYQAIHQLRTQQNQAKAAYFQDKFPKGFDLYTQKNILISKSPQTHKTENNEIALPYHLFLEENASSRVALHISYVLGQYTPEQNVPPSFRAVSNYTEKLRSKEVLRVEDFISIDHLDDHKLSFRIIADQQGLIVPTGKETRLVELLEGGAQNYPIEQVALSRMLNQIEMQIVGSMIRDIKFDELDNDRVLSIGEFFLSLMIFVMLDRKMKLIKKGWIRKPSRIFLWVGGFFAIDSAIDEGLHAAGIDLNASNIELRSNYEAAFMFLTENLEMAKQGQFHVERFKKQFCYILGINYGIAEDLHLFDSEEQWNAYVAIKEKKINAYYLNRKELFEGHLIRVNAWLERLKLASQNINPNTGEISYVIPPRSKDSLDEASDGLFKSSMLVVVGELAFNKLTHLKRILYTGKFFGGIVVSTVVIDYLLAIPDYNPIQISDIEFEILQSDLQKLQEKLPLYIETYELLSKEL